MKTTNLPSLLEGSHIIELHYKRPCFDGMTHIGCAEDADAYLRKHINLKQLDLRESFWVILMTNANRVLGLSEVATGTTLGVQTNIKCICQLALLTNASAMIVAHNHPSGNLKLSHTDMKETQKLLKAAKLLDINLLDHIILSSESFLSFALEGKL